MRINTNKTQQTKTTTDLQGSAILLKCTEFQSLKNWQIERYQQAVRDNRWFMSQKQQRSIDWEEAEQDFIGQNLYGCAEKWRLEYCGELCPHKTNCLLATQLTATAETSSRPSATET